MLKSLCVALRLCSTLTGPAHVIDGDTIVVEGVHVRLAGLDAEELSEPYGKMAKVFMEFITRGGTIECKLTGEKSYNRYVGSCFRDDTDIASALIFVGLALDCPRYSGGKYHKYEPDGARSYLIQKPYC